MNRKTLVQLVVVTGLVLAASNLAGQAVKARFGDVLYKHPCVQADFDLAAEVRDKTGGRIDIKVYDNGQLGGSTDMAEALVLGTQEFLQDSPVFFEKWVPAYTLLDTAFVWNSLEQARATLKGPVGQELEGLLLKKAGVRTLGYTYYGTRHVTANKPIRTLADMKGLKIRVPNSELSIALFQAWGADTVIVNFNELFQALKQGAAEAQENPLPTIDNLRLWSVQKYVILTGHEINIRGIYVNEAWWQKLAQADRQLIQAAVDRAVQVAEAAIRTQEKDLVDKLKANGMIFITPERDQFRQVARKTLPGLFEKTAGKGWFEKISGAVKP